MKLIKIINGTYGFRPQPHAVERKTSTDAPFLVEDQEAERLVALKVAVIVSSTAEPAQDSAPADPEEDAIVYNEDMKLDELKEVAKTVGATDEELKALRSKKDVIALIDKILEEDGDPEEGETAEDQEGAPEVGAADPV